MRANSPSHFLETARLCFRPWTEDDVDLALGLWGDAEVMRLIGGPCSPEQVRARLKREQSTQVEYGVQYWPIFLREGEAHVGCCGLRPERAEEGIYEIGFHLRPAYWGQGYGAEAARGVIAHAFAALGATALIAGHHPANESSRRLLEKLGFHYTHHRFFPPTGLEHPTYRLGAEAWELASNASPPSPAPPHSSPA